MLEALSSCLRIIVPRNTEDMEDLKVKDSESSQLEKGSVIISDAQELETQGIIVPKTGFLHKVCLGYALVLYLVVLIIFFLVV